jgi:hypothetical protein
MQNSIAEVRSQMMAHGQRLMESQKSGGPLTPGPAAPLGSLPTQVMGSPTFTGPQSSTGVATPGSMPAAQPPAGGPKPGGGGEFNWKRAAIVGAIIGLIISAGGIYTFQASRNKKKDPVVAGTVSISVKTNPPGASIRANGEVKGTSDTKIDLAPGSYEIQAVLPGYEPASSKVEVVAGTPASVDLTLQPLPLSVRIYTDMQAGKVSFDGQPYGDLQDGQLILERITAGKHSIKIAAQASEAAFDFEFQPGGVPVVAGPVTAKNILAVLVANAGQQGQIYSSTSGLKVAVDGTAAGEATANGLPLSSLQTGEREFTVNNGSSERKLLVTVSAQPTLTAFIQRDSNNGSLFISTGGEDDVNVFINNIPMRTKSKNGQLRLQGLLAGTHEVKIAKEGFNVDPPQRVTITKGQETRVEFKLKAIIRVASLRVRGAALGTQVFIDGNPVGAIPASGQLDFSPVATGEHSVELRRNGFAPKRHARQFRAGETIEISGADTVLSAALGSLRVNATPATAVITVKGSTDASPRTVTGGSIPLPEGTYAVTGKAQGYSDRTVNVTLAAGENRTIDLALTATKQTVTPPPVQPRTFGMAEWDDPGNWVPDGGWYRRKGGGVVTYGHTPTQGTFTFNISRIDGRRLQWAVDVQDARNYVLFQLERKKFIRREVVNGRNMAAYEVDHHLPDKRDYSIQIEVSPTMVRTFAVGDNGSWREIDVYSTQSRNFTKGKFGFVIPGSDTFGISDFRFVSR